MADPTLPPQIDDSDDGILNPFDAPAEAYDVVWVSGVPSPPTAQVTGFDFKEDWDIKKGKGKAGASMTDQGAPPIKGKVKIRMTTPEHFTQLYAWEKALPVQANSKGGKDVEAADIAHPIINRKGVSSVVLERAGQETDEGGGLWSAEYDFIAFKKPVPAGGSPAKSEPSKAWRNTPPNNDDNAQSKEQSEIDRLAAQAAKP